MPDIPQVYARIVPSIGFGRSARLIVDVCPFCGKTHRHTYSEQTGKNLGVREAECQMGRYELIDDTTKPEGEPNA